MSGLGGAMAQGMAMGTGSAIAHQAINRMMGPSHGGPPIEGQQQQQVAQAPAQDNYQMQQEQNPCASYNMNLLQCLKSSSDNIGLCQDYMNMLNQC